MARYELVAGTSRKFWEITLDGASVTTRWGRIGTEGQQKTKAFADGKSAQKEHDALVREKLAKGYLPVGESATASAARAIRTDLSIYNEATGFLAFSESMIGRQLEPGDTRWAEAVADGDVLLRARAGRSVRDSSRRERRADRRRTR
jgi:predicted DNA-binding WGR domain protein